MYSNDAGELQTKQCLLCRRKIFHERGPRDPPNPFFAQRGVTKINLIADHVLVHISITVKHNHHRSTKADRLSTVATNHEQEENDKHHGHLVHGGFITNRSVQKGGTGRLLHLFG
jgi:hypothetical protein